MTPTRLPAEFLDQIVYIMTTLRSAGDIALVLDLGGVVDEARMRLAVRRMLDAEPVLGCRFVDDLKDPHWVRRDDLDTAPYCEVRAVADRDAALQQCLAEPHDPCRDLLMRVVLLRSGGRDTMVFRVNHVVTDGRATVDQLVALAALYRRLETEPAYVPPVNGADRHSFQWMRVFSWRDRLRVVWSFLGEQWRRRRPATSWGLAKPLDHYLDDARSSRARGDVRSMTCCWRGSSGPSTGSWALRPACGSRSPRRSTCACTSRAITRERCATWRG
jgi:NRPS condensation-like uncharacterized protein